MSKQPVTVTQAAAEHFKSLMARCDTEPAGIKLGVTAQGCSGMSYHMDFAEAPVPEAEVVDAGGVTLYVDPKALMFIVGTEIDYEEGQMSNGFVFRNPNEQGRCGCGASFHV